MRHSRRGLVTGVAALALECAFSPAYAQQASPTGPFAPTAEAPSPVPSPPAVATAPGDRSATQEIVVTAQRRAASVQTVAVAVSAYGGDTLIARGINDLQALSNNNPSLNVANYQGEAQVYIRGIGTPIIIGGTDSSTAIHSDGVFLSRSAAAIPAFFDVERVEVIRGPQGTLYGRNATGGSINLISKGPTDNFEGEARLTIGDYRHVEAFVAESGPLSDKVRFRAAVQYNTHDGYTTINRPQTDPSGRHTSSNVEDAGEIYTRLRLDADITETVTLRLIGDYYRADDKAVTWHVFDRGYSKNGFETNSAFDAAVNAAAARGEYSHLRSRDMYSDIDFYNKPEIWGLSGKLEWRLGDYTLSSLTAYRETHPLNRDDLDYSTANGSDQVREERHHQVSEELQLSSPANHRLEYIVGLYYFNEGNKTRNEYFLATVPTLLGFAPAPDCCLLKLNGYAKTTAYAAFTDGSFKITPKLALRFGARYSYETRGGDNDVELDRVPAFDNVATFKSKSFDAFSPKGGLEFRANKDLFLYFTAVRGFKSGGFNIGSYQNEAFNPEKIWSYEVGAKVDLFDRKLRLNAAAFYYDYSDLQVQDTEQNNVLIRNAASATVKGIELEGVARPTDHFRVDLSGAYLDAKFDKYVAADPKYNNYLAALGVANPNAGACPAGTPNAALPNNPTCPYAQNLSGSRLPKAPEWKFSVGAEYTIELGSRGSVTLRGDYTWQDHIFFSAFQSHMPVAGAPALAVLEQSDYSWVKGRATYNSPSARWSLAAFVDNLTDARVATQEIFTGDIVGSTVAGSLAPPRTIGVEGRIKF